jgi:hypothetical protein
MAAAAASIGAAIAAIGRAIAADLQEAGEASSAEGAMPVAATWVAGWAADTDRI